MDEANTPVGIVEIADRLGVKRATVDQWLFRDLLPPADWTVGGRPAWRWGAIIDWAKNTGRVWLVQRETDGGPEFLTPGGSWATIATAQWMAEDEATQRAAERTSEQAVARRW